MVRRLHNINTEGVRQLHAMAFSPGERTSSTHCSERLGWPQDLVRTLWSNTSPFREANYLPDRSLVTILSWLCCVICNNCRPYANCLSKILIFITSDTEFNGNFRMVFEEFIENTVYVVHLTVCTWLGEADSKRIANRIQSNPVNADVTAILMHINPPVPVCWPASPFKINICSRVLVVAACSIG
jgi:hypothetical protein